MLCGHDYATTTRFLEGYLIPQLSASSFFQVLDPALFHTSYSFLHSHPQLSQKTHLKVTSTSVVHIKTGKDNSKRADSNPPHWSRQPSTLPLHFFLIDQAKRKTRTQPDPSIQLDQTRTKPIYPIQIQPTQNATLLPGSTTSVCVCYDKAASLRGEPFYCTSISISISHIYPYEPRTGKHTVSLSFWIKRRANNSPLFSAICHIFHIQLSTFHLDSPLQLAYKNRGGTIYTHTHTSQQTSFSTPQR